MKKILFCLLASFFSLYFWILLLMLSKLFYLCGKFGWVAYFIQREKRRKVTEVLHLGSVCDHGAVALGDSLYLRVSSHWFYLTAGWKDMGWNLLFKPSPVREVCSGLCDLSGKLGPLLITLMVKNKFLHWVGFFFFPSCVHWPLSFCCASRWRVWLYLCLCLPIR